jgi:hypothetical protein
VRVSVCVGDPLFVQERDEPEVDVVSVSQWRRDTGQHRKARYDQDPLHAPMKDFARTPAAFRKRL